MTTTIVVSNLDKELSRYNITDDAIAKLAEEYAPLEIKGLNDEAGYKLVKKARIDIKNRRCEVEKIRKELKADALAYGRKVDEEAKRIVALLEPIESALEAKQQAIDDEKARIEQAEIEAARLKAEAEEKARKDAEEAAMQAERDRIAAERAELEAERQRVAEAQRAEQERLDAIAREQREAQEKIDAENRRIAEEEAARQRAAELKKAQEEAAEKARIETEARLKREAEEAERKRVESERLAAEEAARLEAAKPDIEKIRTFAAVIRGIQFPKVTTKAAIKFVADARKHFDRIGDECEVFGGAK